MHSSNRMGVGLAVALAAALLGSSCGGDTTTRSSGTATPVERAADELCSDLGEAISVLDRYGRIFTEEPLTLDEVRNDANALMATTAELKASATDLADAITVANTPADAGSGGTTTTVLATKSAQEHLDAIERAERAWTAADVGVSPETTLGDAGAELQSAAFGLEQAYVALFADAGCLAQSATASKAVEEYVRGLQQDLTDLGHYSGPLDGLYGPETVAAVKSFQASASLPESGVVDPQTERAMAAALSAQGKQQALNIAALQGALTVDGAYTGPIDGQWSQELEGALTAYQEAQSLPATGAVDPATLAALLDRSDDTPASTTTSMATTSTSGSVDPSSTTSSTTA